MCHMPAVFARQFDQCAFDERADLGDLPQDRLAPRHEPILHGYCVVHNWTVLLRANSGNKKSACDDFSSQTSGPQPLRRLLAAYLAAFRRYAGATIFIF